MPVNVNDVWCLSGGVVEIDGITPFTRGIVRVVDICDDTELFLGETALGYNGNFHILFKRRCFQETDPNRQAPDVVLRVYDYQRRVLFESKVCMSVQVHTAIRVVLTQMPTPKMWQIRGIVFNQNTSWRFTQGRIAVYCYQNGGPNDHFHLSESGLGDDGQFTIIFSRDHFQDGNIEYLIPVVFFRIFNEQGILIWESNRVIVHHPVYYINPLIGDSEEGAIVPNIPEVSPNWSVYGTVRKGGLPLGQIFTIKAFDVLYSVETELGTAQTRADGAYSIDYCKVLFQKGDSGRIAPNLTVRVFSADDELVAASGLFSQAANHAEININITPEYVSQIWELSGKIRKHDQTPMESGRVDVWDIYSSREFMIGSGDLDSNGDYSITFTKDTFQHGDSNRLHPQLLIRVYDDSSILVGHDYPVYQNSEKYQCDLTLSQLTNLFHASGTILNTMGYPIFGCVVIVKNMLLSSEGIFQEIELGRAVSGETSQGTRGPVSPGVYNISFYPDLVTNLESLDQARFVVEVYTEPDQTTDEPSDSQEMEPDQTTDEPSDSQEMEPDKTTDEPSNSQEMEPNQTTDESPGFLKFAGKSNLIRATEEKLSADIVIDMPSNADISKFTYINSRLVGFAEGSIMELASDESKLEYVADRINESKEEILAIAIATSILSALRYKITDNNDIPNKVDLQIIYALVKTEIAESFQDLLKITADKLQTALISAITQSIIPPPVQDNLSDIISEWREIYSVLLQKEINISNAGRIFKYAMPEPKLSENGEDNENNKYSIYYEYYMTVIETYAVNAHNLEKFWTELEEKLTNESLDPAFINNLIGRLKFFFDIHRFADEFGPLLDAMMEYADEKEYTMLECFVELEKEEWLNGVIERIEDFTKIEDSDELIEWPESVPGESDDEKRNNYATILYRRITSLFTMDQFKSSIDKITDDAESDNSDWWQIVREFLNIKTSFDFADTITDDDFYCDSVTGNDPHTDSGTENERRYVADFTEEQILELYSKLIIIQRLYRLIPKLEVINGLIKNGFTSAMSIAHKNCDEFVEQCSELVGGIDDAQALHATAVHTASQALFLMGVFNQQTDLPQSSIPVVTEKLSAPEQTPQGNPMSTTAPTTIVNRKTTRKQIIPNIATLFGSQNQALCEECQSVFSPSAYMVDLLEFLNDEVRSELFSRRPDLSETDLSCRNTHGSVAYIDLVNEILEDAVCSRSFYITNSVANGFLSALRIKVGVQKKSPFVIGEIPPAVTNEFGKRGFYIDKEFYVQGIKNINNKWYMVGDGWRYFVEPSAGNNSKFHITPYPQTGKNAQLRRVKPEHTHWGAYDVLKHSPYPTTLPFNLPFTEVNEFLKLKKSNRHKLYHVLHTTSEVFNTDEPNMLAFFEMTAKQKNLITTDAKVWELWGFSSQSELLASLGNAESIMKKLDITLDQFLDLIHTYIVSCPDSDNYLYLDWGNDHAYENGELDKLLVKNSTIGSYSIMVRLQRLSNHLGLDVITVSRLISMQVSMQDPIEISTDTLINVFKYLKIAEEFSVSPIRAASWLCGWIENFNLGRGAPSQFEEQFLSNVDTPERAAVWKEMMNRPIDDNNSGKFDTGDGTNDKDIATLFRSLKINHHDLSLIVHEEFNVDLTGLNNVNLTITNLAKMFRTADFSRALGISVSDFYKLRSILLGISVDDFSPEFLIKCRSVLIKLKKSKISIDEFQYLISGANADEISWLPAEKDVKLKTIIKIHNKVDTTKHCYAEDAPDLNRAIEETILNELAASYKISADICRTILEKALKTDSGETLLQHWVDICAVELDETYQPESILEENYGYLDKIANVVFLIRTLNIPVDEFDFLTDYLYTVYEFNFNKLGTLGEIQSIYEPLNSLLDIYTLGRELPYRNKNFTIFNLLQKTQDPDPETPFGEIIVKVIDWPYEDISEVINLFNFSYVEFRKIDTWFTLNRICELLKKIGLTVSFASTLVSDADNSPSQSEALIGTLSAGYTQSQWIEIAEPIRNDLRRLQRDALCAYLLSERSKSIPMTSGFETDILNSLLNYKLGKNGPSSVQSLNENLNEFQGLSNAVAISDIWDLLDGRTGPVNRAAIYAKYLIDISMDTDVITTRIVQANSSIQMLLQRALLNFERISLDDKIKQQWSWMKNYRLWEANRKIFLYPENWLDPEFRDDKTPLFKDFESTILQKELNPSNIREAFKAYASGLNEIANLEVIGAYADEGKGGKVLHVVGRTFHYPYSYYYRRNHDTTGGSGYWTPWEKVDLDITSDVVLPVPFRNKIYIFWPIIEVKEKAVENEKSNQSNQSQHTGSFKYYEIKLAWSEFSDGKWSAKRISQHAYSHLAEHIDNELIRPTDIFHFRVEIKSNEVEIQTFAYNKIIEEITTKTKLWTHKEIVELFDIKREIRIPAIQQVIRKENKEAISKVAVFSFGSDNNANLVSVADKRNYMISTMIPPGTIMRHNRAEESEKRQNYSDFGALEYPAGNVLFKRTPEQFICFPTNLSFFDNTPDTFFLRLNEKTLFIKPVPPPSQSSLGTSRMLDTGNTTYYQIVNFYHPLADDLIGKANLNSVDDLLNRSVQANAKDQYPLGYAAVGDEHAGHLAKLSFQYQYLPQKVILGDYPVPANEFSLNSAFGLYNWELFFHLPMYIANRLSYDNQYEEAMRWFHYIFNPAIDFTIWEKTQRWTWDLPEGARFWNFLPFFASRGVLDSIYKAVEKSQIPNQDTNLGILIEDWKNNPFKPHLIARIRVAAYQKSVVMKYLDNIIEWGDSLFRLDNMESINEATTLYAQAAEILGDKPVLVPKLHEMPGLTYTQLKAEGLDQFSNTVVQLENYIPPAPPVKVRVWRAKQAPSHYYYYHYNYDYTYNSSVEAIPHSSVQLLRMAPALNYFCIPRNARLVSYWDLVEDRLFKIRHSLNIDGIKRVIPLFAPPIDPGMLARASAMGIDISEVLRDIQSAPTVYRYATVYQKALELCNELKAFGSELLSAIEKKDAESLALLRNNHEIELLKLVKEIKKNAVEESIQNLEVLLKTKAMTEERYDYYKNIERTSETEMLQLAASGAAAHSHVTGQIMALAAGPIELMPDMVAGALIALAGGPILCSQLGGGKKMSNYMTKFANALMQSASILDRVAGVSGIKASYDRRWKEWKLQEKLAEKELAQIDKQILCAQIRVRIAEHDLSNHDKQIEQAQSLKEVMESKFSNEKLYQWMADELNKSYKSMYDIAYSAAKKTEKAFQFELGSSKTFVSQEIWNSAKKGLLAGNGLSVQLRQMDAAYIENNKRELEITKAVSLNMLEPEQLLKLRETGSCEFELPELIYDLDCPGQFFRRIKSARITIPCVAGPYTNISAKLTLLNSRIRVNTTLKNDEYREESEISDDRFLYNPIPVGASISTSGAMMDSGMFEFNFRDERYLPFEGAGAIGKWNLELPTDYRQFDYGTIADVILHISYTAREAVSIPFKESVTEYLDDYLEDQEFIPNLVDLSQSFHDQFKSIVHGEIGEITLDEEEHFPYLVVDYWRRKKNTVIPDISELKIFVLLKNVGDGDLNPKIKINKKSAEGIRKWQSNLYELEFTNVGSCPWNLELSEGTEDTCEIEDIFLYFGYSIKR